MRLAFFLGLALLSLRAEALPRFADLFRAGSAAEVAAAWNASSGAEKDDRGRTPLMLAAFSNGPEVVRFLLAHGALPDERGPDGMTALHYAALQNTPEVVGLLFSATTNAANQANARGKTALHLAAEFNRNPEVAKQLLRTGAVLEARDARGRTPLMGAAVRNTQPVIQALLDAGADVRARDAEGRTPYQFAAGEVSGPNAKIGGLLWVLYRGQYGAAP